MQQCFAAVILICSLQIRSRQPVRLSVMAAHQNIQTSLVVFQRNRQLVSFFKTKCIFRAGKALGSADDAAII